MSHVRADLAQDHAELGATLNGFSLNETGQLSTAIEKTGQAVDATYMSTTQLVCTTREFDTLLDMLTRSLIATGVRTELGGTFARVFAIRVHHQEIASIPTSEACAI